MADAGADAIEVGIPFSDPAMDGPTIEEASVRALARGTTPAGILGELAGRTVLVNLSGRGDKDVAQVAEMLRRGVEEQAEEASGW